MIREPYRRLRKLGTGEGFWSTYSGLPNLGSLNNQNAETIQAATQLVRNGTVFNLDYPVNAFDPPMFADRETAQHNVFTIGPLNLDDSLSGYSLQGSSHVDGLLHVAHPEFGFFGGHAWDSAGAPCGTLELGVQAWAESGIFGRGVLIDLYRHRSRQGRAIDWDRPEAFQLSEILAAAADQEVEIRSGDAVLLYTGWLDHYFFPKRPDLKARMKCVGVAQSEEFLEWLWDTGISLIAADNIAVEVLPAVRDSPFRREYRGGLMHPILIPLLGMVVGELWRLGSLVEHCANDGVYEFLVTASPLNLTGGVGSPANAYAVK